MPRKIRVRCTFEIDVEIPDSVEDVQFMIEENSCPGTGFVGSAVDAEIESAHEKGVCWACNLRGRNEIIPSIEAIDVNAERVSIATAESQILNTYEPDDTCCGRALRKVDLSTLESWTCPRCGMDWAAEIAGEIRHWTPRPAISVFRPNGPVA